MIVSTFVAAAAYALADVGNCAANVGTWIESKVVCEAAAARLGLPGSTAANGNPYASNPYGCYWKKSAQALFWSLAGNKNDDDTDRVSVCVTPGKSGRHRGVLCGRTVCTHRVALRPVAMPTTTVAGLQVWCCVPDCAPSRIQ